MSERWEEIGAYLSRDDALLLSKEERIGLRSSWEETSQLEAALDGGLLVALVGGTGVGKSTLINALAGEEISRSGDRRPTTDRVIVYRHRDASLAADVPIEDLSQPQVLHERDELEKVIVLDFPDFDSADTNHEAILGRYLPYLDLLFIVVDDMKYGDRRLYDLLREVSQAAENLFGVVNKFDVLETRYGERAGSVAADMREDFRGKLREFAGVDLREEQVVSVSCLRALEAKGSSGGSDEGFERLENLLETYQADKLRRAAKELNLAARKAELARELRRQSLTDEQKSILEDSVEILRDTSKEVADTVAAIPVSLFSERERRDYRRPQLRRRGGEWGMPISLVYSLIGEWWRAPKLTGTERPVAMSERTRVHYRSVFESLENLEARVHLDFAASGAGVEEPRAGSSDESSSDVCRRAGAEAQRELDAVEVEPKTRSKRMVHVPAALAAGLGVLSVLRPLWALDEGFFHALTEVLFRLIDPFFLVGWLLSI
ncbi:MAG: dynamin family protein, partial [Planctomycetota bacterium]